MNDIEYLKQMLLSGVNNLHNNYPHIDKLNVFPVPDGDTGTNMNLTVTNGYAEIKNMDFKTIGEMLKTFSRGLVLGARGNSGVIFSQIWRGFATGMADAKDLSIAEWKKGFASAVEVAYKAVSNPVEGTILTVIRETSEGLQKESEDIDKKAFWTDAVKFADAALESTPDLLPALKAANVVDSGGYGLVKFIEGIQYFVANDDVIQQKKNLEVNNGGNIDMKLNQEFGYCTEIIGILPKEIQGKLTTDEIKKHLDEMGNTSMVVVIDDDILKVHTHAKNPGEVLNYLQQFGEFKKIKIENMTLQSDRQVKGGNPNINAAWHETSEVAAERTLEQENGMVAVVQSDEQKEYFENEVGVDFAINAGSKMNPSTQDFLEAIETANAKVVYLLPDNKNAVLAANTAQQEEKLSKVVVIPTSTVQQGMVSALNFDPDGSAKDNEEAMTEATKQVVSFTISKAAKDSVVDGINVKKDKEMAIVDGKIIDTQDTIEDIFENDLVKYLSDETEIVTVFTGQNALDNDVKKLKKILDEKEIESDIVSGGQKVYSYLISIE